ncbi:MAG: hypothetical protein FWC45_08695 [Treponema sp.]|nr:hypothetical protein [Treponema sp.]
MLLDEWDIEKAKEVWYEEGMERGQEKEREDIALKALKKDLPVEMIRDITGLDVEIIMQLRVAGPR